MLQTRFTGLTFGEANNLFDREIELAMGTVLQCNPKTIPEEQQLEFKLLTCNNPEGPIGDNQNDYMLVHNEVMLFHVIVTTPDCVEYTMTNLLYYTESERWH